ncbi:mitochondrial carrier domain-containing protein [Mycotypha africana]|uniref:mitochondrial carrier domain-containing protein n=1 Tax=Mycotypha africana TaxID=64632 RepID=UPI002300CEEC|nr:mitochondrial carrier domain-containing protein [Mycotypha africana]KAI8981937.1 mitochondrial carrier domain-containing protein [Mycotypha africana]
MHHPEEEEDYDYESLGNDTTMLQNAFAGALAGIAEHCAMYPVDSIKTRMQVISSTATATHPAKRVSTAFENAPAPCSTRAGTTATATASSMGRATYLRHLWKGVNSVVLGAGPAHALHFATYEFCKEQFVKSPSFFRQHERNPHDTKHHPLAFAAAGACATLAHDSLMNPFDVVKQRMQLQGSTYTTIFDCARKVYAREGFIAFYISLPTTLVMSIPFQSIQFATYEFFRKTLLHYRASTTTTTAHGDEDHEPRSSTTQSHRSTGGGRAVNSHYDPQSHILAGALAGAVASSVTTPLDVVKTLLQTRGTSTDPVVRNANGFVDGAKIIFSRYGLRGFFRGYKPRVLTHMPSAAISWSVYEYIKWMINTQNNQHLHQKDENFVSL